MIKQFEKAMELLGPAEGGFVNDPNDPGGATNWGISLRWLQSLDQTIRLSEADLDFDGDVDIDDIKAMPKVVSESLYYRYFWLPYGYEGLPEIVSPRVFLATVHTGPYYSHKLLQRAINTVIRRSHTVPATPQVAVDGWVGEKTMATACLLDPEELLASWRILLREHYRKLIDANPLLESFRNGWMNRANL